MIYGDEEYTQGLIFDEANNAHTLSWTGSYEKVIREGLESIIRELEERKAGIEGNLLHNQMDKIYYLDAAILSLQGHDYICPPLCGQGRGDGRGGERPGTPGRAGDHRGDLPPCARAPRPELL